MKRHNDIKIMKGLGSALLLAVSLSIALPTLAEDSKTSLGQGGSSAKNVNAVSIEGVLSEVPRERIDLADRRAESIRTIEAWQNTVGEEAKNNTLWLADAGEGKSVATRAIVQYMPENMVMLKMDINAMIAGTGYRGNLQDKFVLVEKEVKKLVAEGKHVVLWIDEAHVIMSESFTPVRERLKEFALESNKISIHLTTTTSESAMLEKDPAIVSRFIKMFLQRLSRDGLVATLMKEAKKTKYKFTVDAIELIVDRGSMAGATSTRDFVGLLGEVVVEMNSSGMKAAEFQDVIRNLEIQVDTYKNSPVPLTEDQQYKLGELERRIAEQKELLKAAESKGLVTEVQKIQADIEKNKKDAAEYRKNGQVSSAMMVELQVLPQLEANLQAELAKGEVADPTKDPFLVDTRKVAEVISRKSNGVYSVDTILANDKELYLNVQENLDKIVKGMDDAKQIIAEVLKKKAAADVFDGKNRVPAFGFDGLPGAGKSYLGKSLAKVLGYKHFDLYMADYANHDAVERLIGTAGKYRGAENGGTLTNAIQKYKRVVIELAEFDQASPEAQKLIYQLIEEGRLVDGQGKPVDASEVIVIVTMNISAKYLAMRPAQRRAFEMQYLVEQKKIFTQEEFERHLENGNQKKITHETMRHLQLDSGKVTSAMHSRIAGMLAISALPRKTALTVVPLEIQKQVVPGWKRAMRIDVTTSESVHLELVKLSYSRELGMRPLDVSIDTYLKNPMIDVRVDPDLLSLAKKNGNIHVDYISEEGRFVFTTTDSKGTVTELISKQVENFERVDADWQFSIEADEKDKAELERQDNERRERLAAEGVIDSEKMEAKESEVKSVENNGRLTAEQLAEAQKNLQGYVDQKSAETVTETEQQQQLRDKIVETARTNTESAAANSAGEIGKPVSAKESWFRRVIRKIFRK